MEVFFNNSKIELEEGVDIGYEVDKCILESSDGHEFVVPRRGITTLLVSTPFFDEGTVRSIKELDEEFFRAQVEGFEAAVVLSKNQTPLNDTKFFKYIVDNNNDFAVEFGTAIESGELQNHLAKALFVVSRDHVLFYKEFCKNFSNSFNIEKLFQVLGKALNVYSGTGCH